MIPGGLVQWPTGPREAAQTNKAKVLDTQSKKVRHTSTHRIILVHPDVFGVLHFLGGTVVRMQQRFTPVRSLGVKSGSHRAPPHALLPPTGHHANAIELVHEQSLAFKCLEWRVRLGAVFQVGSPRFSNPTGLSAWNVPAAR